MSMFTAGQDIRIALSLIAHTAFAHPRNESLSSLQALKNMFCSLEGYEALSALFLRFQVGPVLPRVELAKLFDRELISLAALERHRGRDVYGKHKIGLWNALWTPLMPYLAPHPKLRKDLAGWVAKDTSWGGPGVSTMVKELEARLSTMGFAVERIVAADHAPMLVAHREPHGHRGHLVMYGHYDVESPQFEFWDNPPFELIEREARWYGVGVGDNKGALLVRLRTVAQAKKTPRLTWIIQGEEERGSPLAHQELAPRMAKWPATLWLEENGYHDLDGTQRFLARSLGTARERNQPPDEALQHLMSELDTLVRRYGIQTRVEHRSLNKSFFPDGCPFENGLPEGARYLAIGINDPMSGIHRPNESIPLWTLPIHEAQLLRCFDVVDVIAED